MIENKTPVYVPDPVLVLVGPTAVGKTALSLELSHSFNGEIVSVDSMQVYRYMDIGTAKASRQERSEVPHHLIDIVDPDDEYNAARFARDALDAVLSIHARMRLPVLTGGSGLYLRALKTGLFPVIPADSSIRKTLNKRLDEEGSHVLHAELNRCDPVSAGKIHQNDTYRIIRGLEVFLSSSIPLSKHIELQKAQSAPIHFTNMLTIGLTSSRNDLYERIDQRASLMIEQGLQDEVEQLVNRGYGAELKSMQSIGYRHMLNYIGGLWTMEETTRLLARDTRHYAKRQFTWFNKDTSIHWMDCFDHENIHQMVDGWLLAAQAGGR